MQGLSDRTTYSQHYITNETQATVTVTDDSIYNYTLSEPLQVQSGDIVGIALPLDDEKNANSIRPLFIHLSENDSDTLSCARRSDSEGFFLLHDFPRCLAGEQQLTGYIPLISVVIGKFIKPLLQQIEASLSNWPTARN